MKKPVLPAENVTFDYDSSASDVVRFEFHSLSLKSFELLLSFRMTITTMITMMTMEATKTIFGMTLTMKGNLN